MFNHTIQSYPNSPIPNQQMNLSERAQIGSKLSSWLESVGFTQQTTLNFNESSNKKHFYCRLILPLSLNQELKDNLRLLPYFTGVSSYLTCIKTRKLPNTYVMYNNKDISSPYLWIELVFSYEKLNVPPNADLWEQTVENNTNTEWSLSPDPNNCFITPKA